MSLKNKTTQKFISGLIIFTMIVPAVLLSFKPKQAEAVNPVGVPVNDFTAQISLGAIVASSGTTAVKETLSWGEQLLKRVLMVVAKRILAKITQATINWINSGFHGSPLFLENPESFFKDIAKAQVRSIVDMIGYDTFRFPFGKQTALNVIDSYKRQLSDNAQYTLSKVINDPDLLRQYRNDFNYGGWNGFLINTQYPQNNYLGFNMIIEQNLASKLEGTLQAPAQKVQSLLQQGMGFLSPQTCPSNPKYNNGTNEFLKPSFKSKVVYTPPNYDPNDPSRNLELDREARERYQDAKDIERVVWTEQNTCPGGLVSTTPGAVVGSQITNALGSSLRTTELGAALGNSIDAIFDALINKLLDTGLNALSNTISPGSGNDDNWSYDGQTLGGSIPPIASGTLNIPQNVSVSVGQGTSTDISGGIAPYSIIQTNISKEIANATISTSGSAGPKLTVIGKTPGTTTILIHDSSTPSKTATITITVDVLGALVVTPVNILTRVNDATVATISGGEGNYFIQTSPDQQIAVANLSGINLVISGIAPGTTYLEIRDSSPIPKITRVDITVNDPGSLTVTQEKVLVYTGSTTNINTFISGEKNITMTVAGIITIEPGVNNTTLKLTSVKKGSTIITIKGPNHSPQNPQIAEFYVTVADKLISTPLAYSHSLYYGSDISGGTAPYRIISCSTTMIVCTPPFNSYTYIEGSRLWVYSNGTKGSSNLEIGDSSGQTVIVPFVRN